MATASSPARMSAALSMCSFVAENAAMAAIAAEPIVMLVAARKRTTRNACAEEALSDDCLI